MSYIKNTLMSTETIVCYTRPHRIIFASTISWLILAILFFKLGPKLDMYEMILIDVPIYILLSICSLGIGLFYFIATFIKYISSEYAVTNKRVLMKIGLIHRRSSEIFLDKVESINVRQGLLGRIFNFGSIIIAGTGGSKDQFNYIPKPLLFRRTIQQQIEDMVK